MYINSAIPWHSSEEKFTALVQMAYRVGFQAIIVNLHSQKEYSEFSKSRFFPRMRPGFNTGQVTPASISFYQSETLPIPVFPRITISPSNPEELKKSLSQIIQHSSLIAVESSDKAVLEIAARDGRVDILSLPEDIHQKSITKGIISLAKQNGVVLDLSLSPLITQTHYKRTRLMRGLYRLIKMAKPGVHRFSLGSHDTCKEDPFIIRGPRESMALLHALLDIPLVHASSFVKENPEMLVLNFIKRHQGVFIEPGVEIIQKDQESENGGKRR